jgi:hypothetical protein
MIGKSYIASPKGVKSIAQGDSPGVKDTFIKLSPNRGVINKYSGSNIQLS